MREVNLPPDKSITHRALMLAASARGVSRVRTPLAGADCLATAAVLRRLGAPLPELCEEVVVRSDGLHTWRAPDSPLDCGNSGTTARLMMGLLAGRPFSSVLTGDASLKSRPMRRVSEPLAGMGAKVRELGEPDRLPLEVTGGRLRAAHYRTPVPSAQIKSAVILAGLSAGVPVRVSEGSPSRDHTEVLLREMGARLETRPSNGGRAVFLDSSWESLSPLDLTVPGDFSSASFLIALGLLTGKGMRLPGVGVNPTRTGLLAVLERMGARLVVANRRQEGGEPVADLEVNPASLGGVEVGGDEIPALIDELPVLAVLAAVASGETRLTGAGELRLKESDRVRALAENLRAVGAAAEELPDGLVISGSDRGLSGRVRTRGDHRVAMSFGVLAALPGNRIEIDDPDCVEISFPGFWKVLGNAAGR